MTRGSKSTGHRFFCSEMSDNGSVEFRNLLSALYAFDVARVKDLVDNYSANVHLRDNDGWTCLHIATVCYPTITIPLLIPRFKDAINDRNSNGDTPLSILSTSLCTEVSKLLLHNGAIIHTSNHNGKSPIYRSLDLKSTSGGISRCPFVLLLLDWGPPCWPRDDYRFIFGTSLGKGLSKKKKMFALQFARRRDKCGCAAACWSFVANKSRRGGVCPPFSIKSIIGHDMVRLIAQEVWSMRKQ